MSRIQQALFVPLLTGVCFSPSLWAIETAPRISDREIIESLTELKTGQKNLEKQMDQRFEQMQSSIDQRFEQVDQRFGQMQSSIDQRFEQVDQRFEQMQNTLDQRFTFIENLILVMIASILGLVGYIVWDRKTALKPLEKKLDKLEEELRHDLELQSPEGSRLTRVIHAFREMARTDARVADTLRQFSLL